MGSPYTSFVDPQLPDQGSALEVSQRVKPSDTPPESDAPELPSIIPLFVKSHIPLPLSQHQLCTLVAQSPLLREGSRVLKIVHMKEAKGVKHEFLLVQARIPDQLSDHFWLRIERGVTPTSRDDITMFPELWESR
jgi:hypothetical protein